ncbi:RNA-directed DNA polymerase [Ruminiclostridium herbifermentans]|uniref:RNA-directed DNA polymerase n=1 Tax=Ruminiclostridium herbifermentans TaxID=2488810 RepID=A0A4U7JMF8_9FIRM|nr:RNA-directed DNA polymerase [Ruminiclostridium herbifermentans]QNU65453.1 RNA-directed DNA polymerase [Ruminiclostridium herbifermentans]
MLRDYNKIEKEIAETGFFSEYLPPCFKLDQKVFMRVPPENCDLIQPYCFTMSRYNNNDARRNIFIPEIGAYTVVRNYIRQENIIKELIEFTENNEASFSPILGENDSIMRHEQAYSGTTTQIMDFAQLEEISSNYIENIAKKIIKATGAKKVLKLDISNCFSSFYMHMIPAILLGVEETERNYNKFIRNPDDQTISNVYRKYRKLDEVLRRQNLNRTNGLLPGPLISKIIAEGILTRIDKELNFEGIKFSRYVDDYEIYLFNDDEKSIISIFTRVLKKYGFSLNYEKTEIDDFPYYVVENLEKIFKGLIKESLDNSELMKLFNTYLLLEKNGTKGAIRYLLKTLEQNPIQATNISLYKAYLLTIIENNDRSLTKACSLFIKNKENLTLDVKDVVLIKDMITKHIRYEHDLEVLWLLYLLVETGNNIEQLLVEQIIESRNELAKIILLRKDLLESENISQVRDNAFSWILIYELYVSGHIDEMEFISKLNLNKNLELLSIS